MSRPYALCLAMLTSLVGFLVGISSEPRSPRVVYVPQPPKVEQVERIVPIMGEAEVVTRVIEREPTPQPFACVVGRWLD